MRSLTIRRLKKKRLNLISHGIIGAKHQWDVFNFLPTLKAGVKFFTPGQKVCRINLAGYWTIPYFLTGCYYTLLYYTILYCTVLQCLLMYRYVMDRIVSYYVFILHVTVPSLAERVQKHEYIMKFFAVFAFAVTIAGINAQ